MYSKSEIWKHFDSLPDSAAIALNDCVRIANRSRASLYRDEKAGKIELLKVGCSTKVRVSELRRYISGDAATANPRVDQLQVSATAARITRKGEVA